MPGDLPALVFIHGFLGSLHDWGDLPHRIAPDRWFTLLELPGHGDEVEVPLEAFTTVGCVKHLLARIHEAAIGEFVLVGYSMGGRLGMHLALAAGEACVGAVFESTSLGIETEEDRDARRNADDQWAERFETEPIERVLRDWYQRSVFSSLASRPELAKRILAMRSRNESAGVAHALRRLGAGSVPSVRGRLGDFKMPVLFIAGADDTKYVDEVQNAAGLCPQGRAVIVPGSGHCPHLENPDGFCGVVREFLSDTRC